jgi:Domain of unknown function (DUF4388)
MPLQGTFDVLGFADVLRLAARRQLTGRLHVRSRSFSANLFIEDGLLVGADQTEHQAAAAAGDVRARLEEICFELLDADRGAFELHPCKPASLPAATRLEVDSVLERARKRIEEWRALREAIPSLDLQPRLVVELEREQVTVDRQRWRVLTAIDGRRNLRAIGRGLRLCDFDLCRLINTMLVDGIIELHGAGLLSVAQAADTGPTVEPAARESPEATLVQAKNASLRATQLQEATPPTEADRTGPSKDKLTRRLVRIPTPDLRLPPMPFSAVGPESVPGPPLQVSAAQPDSTGPHGAASPAGRSPTARPDEATPETAEMIQPESPETAAGTAATIRP